MNSVLIGGFILIVLIVIIWMWASVPTSNNDTMDISPIDMEEPEIIDIEELEPEIIEEPEPEPIRMYTTAHLSLRAHPNQSAEAISVIPKYEIVDVYLSDDQYVYVNYGDLDGYIHSSYLHNYLEDIYLNDLGLEFYYQDLIRDLIDVFEFDVDEFFFYGLMYTESRFTNDAESHLGAQGILQIMPETWEDLYVKFCDKYPEQAEFIIDDPTDIYSNITISMYYFKILQENYGVGNFSENTHKMLAMYNYGPGGSKRYYENNGTYVNSHSTKVMEVAEYIRTNHTWKEGL